ncbi:hypothetical protein PUR71_00385, partial [Streptomyces sp. SP17BM10]|uniref:hypothetical protein n=1 Tax=Streptomyces sp. SP17BM10 TaxID=3002530 RepID=UPI002E770BBD
AAVEFAEQQERAAAHCAQAAALATARAREAAPDDAQEAPVAALERLTADWAQLERAARRQDVDRAKVMQVDHLIVVPQARSPLRRPARQPPPTAGEDGPRVGRPKIRPPPPIPRPAATLIPAERW